MSNARNLANLLGTGTQVKTAKVADEVFQANESLIINGDMAVAQRATSSTTLSGYLTVDRFETYFAATDQLAVTQSQSTTVPSGQGFANSLKLEVTTAETALAADELGMFRQIIEAQNLQHLCFGTSSAKSLTLSFWVRSSLAGKYSVMFYNFDANRSNLQSFTINAANTWEYKTITIDGDTDSGGSFNNDNGQGLQITWILAAGTDWTGTPHTGWGAYTQTDDYAFSDQVNFIAQTGTFYITGAKLEIGSVATPYRHESYTENLTKCQRYYWRIQDNLDNNKYQRYGMGQIASGNARLQVQFPVEMRTEPSVEDTGTASNYGIYNGTTVKSCTTTFNRNDVGGNRQSVNLYIDANGINDLDPCTVLSDNNTSAFLAFNAEL